MMELRLIKESKKQQVCEDGSYSKRSLKLAYGVPFAALFEDSRGERKFEASDVIKVDDKYYAVHDNSWAISQFSVALKHFSAENVQIGNPNREPDESAYEAIVHSDGIFYVIRESIDIPQDGEEKSQEDYHAIVEELRLSATDYEIVNKCRSEFAFEGASKGFEGAFGIKDINSSFFVVGLCEGNYCSEKYKKERGNGMLVVMQKTVSDDGDCMWSTIKKIKIPKTAFFQDYSSIAVNEKGRVVISSQEDSKIWIGQLTGLQENGLYDIDQMSLVDSNEPEVYDFPMNDNCEVIYCNIEGVFWINDDMLVAVSDKMKGKGKQPFRCFDKDQSVHVFVLPS
eukprot:CAMPEP_0172425954 /NCGR_PEP_ID=MMETSP1064-20121228/35055_1 /TAXON_ID=202472 /ORGANISM="Aulacoseira subarctica , Strain CCAP 1002/5" /LENGTH=339 /DNA_ID=CAMNT_0013169263 /DNA_START=195 /DNA_END=1214 /DNA_ORIENTATION=-